MVSKAIPEEAADWCANARRTGQGIAFVPTMGALHEGHLSLVKHGLDLDCRVVCSIFVNPLQFNNPEDLAKYPDRLAEDRELLEATGCDMLFCPSKEDLFRDFTPRTFDLGRLDAYWEGPARPGHFQGVVNVVHRMFAFVRPDAALFGEKDRQQLAIIRHVAAEERWPERIIGRPTVRSADGLALSSRNLRLSPEERIVAVCIYEALSAAEHLAFKVPVAEAVSAGRTILESRLGRPAEYFGIADSQTLAPLPEWGDCVEAVALAAAEVGPVRLIDNLTLHRL